MDCNNSNDNFNPENDDEEQRNFLSVITAFKYYRYLTSLLFLKKNIKI